MSTPPPPSGWQPPPADAPPPGAYPPPYSAQPGYGVGSGRPAEWWRRFLAILLDAIILGVPYFILAGALGFGSTETDPITGELTFDYGALLSSSMVSLAMSLLYAGLLDGSAGGQTVGKMALGIRVRDVNTGGPIGFGRAVLRRFVYTILWYLLVIPGLLNVLWPLWDPQNQAWHDKAVGSVVVMKDA